MNHRRRFACLVLACASLALSGLAGAPAGAQPSSAEQRSRALFQQAKKLADAGKWTEACPLFQAAHDLNSTGGTALQTANCYEQTGKPDRALPLYEFIVSRPDAQKNPERVAIAEERIEALRKQLGATSPEDAALPGATPREGDAPPGKPGAAEGTGQGQEGAGGQSAPPPQGAGEDQGPSRAPAYVALGAGGVGIAVGAVAGVLALSQAADVQSRCEGDRCLRTDAASKDAAYAKGWVSTVGFGVGAVGVAVGVVLLATGGGRPPGRVSADARGVTVRF